MHRTSHERCEPKHRSQDSGAIDSDVNEPAAEQLVELSLFRQLLVHHSDFVAPVLHIDGRLVFVLIKAQVARSYVLALRDASLWMRDSIHHIKGPFF